MGGPNFDRLYHKLKVVIVKLQLHDAIYQQFISDFNCCCFNISLRQ